MSRVRYPDEAPRRGASAAASRARARDAAIDDSRDRGNDRGAERARAKSAQKAGGLPLRLAHWALRNPAASGGALVSTVMLVIIVANAFANQASKHPSPFFATRDRVAEAARASAASRSADPASGEAQTLPRPKPNPAEIALVQNLQQALKDSGLYQGAVDGIAGPATQDAIRAFEKQVGLVPTGEPSERLLAALKALAARTRQSALAPGTQGASGSEADGAPGQPVQQIAAQSAGACPRLPSRWPARPDKRLLILRPSLIPRRRRPSRQRRLRLLRRRPPAASSRRRSRWPPTATIACRRSSAR
ncbi:peptidoglycan-binding protein [Methyloraptor flagellatus]|uniref:Peptidoglycan-binding domain-containing protein n=1 Tax=Methyloraptor flagellatus TaxID=3162530 RepID=A0AAU7X543_9HYPH